MNPEERMERVLACGTPDRTPVALRLEYCAARWAGVTAQDFTDDPWRASGAIEWVYDQMGGWDAVDNSWTLGARFTMLEAWSIARPGVELPQDSPYKMIAKPAMLAEDYDVAINEGLYGLYRTVLGRLGKRFDEALVEEVFTSFRPIYKHWKEKGAVVFRGGKVKLPMSHFQWSRTWPELTKDLLRIPGKVKEAGDAIFEEALKMGERQSRIVDCKYVFIPASKSTLGSKRLFEELLFPYLKDACHTLVNEGFIPRIHFDLDWTPYLEYFLELPKRRCIGEFESSSDLRQVKKMLGGHMCISGGVPPGLLVRGSPDDVTECCRNLMKDMGPDGYILANDDMVPTNAKYENVKAIVDAAKKYGWS